MHFWIFYSTAIGTEVQNEVGNFWGLLFLEYSLRQHGIKSLKRQLFFLSVLAIGAIESFSSVEILITEGNLGKFKMCFSQNIGC